MSALSNCNKDQFTKSGVLAFSNDTLTFDTVFTSLGSTTRYFKIKNTDSKSVNISSLKLAGLSGNQYRMNVDGVAGRSFNNIAIPGKDSLYVFVEVTVDPNSSNNPFVLIDEVQFITNGVAQKVVLQAWGQNAYYHLGERYTSSHLPPNPWPNDKPHIILRGDSFPGLEVKNGITLNIQQGTKIFMGANSLISVDGNLNVNGSGTDSVVFRGIRLESFYNDKPGQWLGIIYGRTANVNMTKTIINESYFGLSDEHVLNVLAGQRVTTSNINTYTNGVLPNVTLSKTIIKNSSSTALTLLGTNATVTNSLFFTAGSNMVLLGVGGNYNFTNCTLGNGYGRYLDHKNASLVVTNQIVDIDNSTLAKLDFNTAPSFTNTLIYGTLDNEIAYVNSSGTNPVDFKNCLIKMDADSFFLKVQDTTGTGNLFNQNPKFINSYSSNYQPDSISPVIDRGLVSGAPFDDLFDKPYSSLRDIGAIQAKR